jgi:hypothetical protein
MSTCFSPWLAPSTNYQVPCTNMSLGKHHTMATYMAYWVDSQHPGSYWSAPPLVSQHLPWMSTCFSPWLAPSTNYQVPCTNMSLGKHHTMATYMAYWVDSQHPGSYWSAPPLVSQHLPWMSTCFSPWLAPSTNYQVPCTNMLLGKHPTMATCMHIGLTINILVVARVPHP